MQMTTTTTTQTATIEQQLGQLFNTIHLIWNANPNHFGHKVFDDFIKSIPNSYYYLLSFQEQKKRLLQQQQQQQRQRQQQQKSSNKPIPSSLPTNQSPPSSPTPQPQHAVIVNKRPKRSCVAAPTLQTIDEQTSSFSSPFASPSPPSSSSTLSPEDKLNIFAAEFVPTGPSKTVSSDHSNINKIEEKTTIIEPKSYKKLEPFVPAHAARAKLNIYIPKHMTKKLLSNIAESFPNTGTLYYYLDISTALQINDGQVHIIETINGEQLAFINFDLHKKGTGELLYAVIIANDQHKIEANKWLWKLSEFLTIKDIEDRFDILEEDLPQSSRSKNDGLYNQWQAQKDKNIDISILNKVNWAENNQNTLKQIGSSQKGKKAKKSAEIKIVLNQNYWINECRKSWNALPAIPIVVYENRDINQHWIEWVKMIHIEAQNAYIGISCKYTEDNNEWEVRSICLDKGDLHNKHRLMGLNYNDESKIDYDAYFNNKFNTKITEIQWKL